MQRIEFTRLLAAAALAATLGACSNDIGTSDLDPSRKIMTMLRPNWLTFSGHQDDLTLPPVTEADLINREGQCAYAAPANEGALPQGGVSLQMTECEVINRAGTPDNIEFGASERSERLVSLTYLGGPRPGIYRFITGRLTSIERAPDAPAAPKQQRPPAKKSNRA
jgi:hypothetical protein